MKRILPFRLFEASAAASEPIDEGKFMSWMELLSTSYEKQGFEFKSWQNDTRMFGLSVSAAMAEGIKRGFVVERGTKWFATNKGISETKAFFFRDNKEAAEKLSRELESKYPYNREDSMSNSKYPIHKIPIELYREYAKEQLRLKHKPSGTISEEDYGRITKFLERYQRDDRPLGNNMKKFAGHPNELCDDKEYVLYRGISLGEPVYRGAEEEHLKIPDNLHVGGVISSTHDVQSWTTSEDIAKQFAYGNPTPMEVTLAKHRFPDTVGVILKHTFKPADIILDFVYVDDVNPRLKGAIFWPVEEEVLIKAKPHAAFEIYKII